MISSHTFNTIRRKPLSLILALALCACNGSNDSPREPTSGPLVTKKIINVDNIDSAFSTYLLYQYRLNQELPKLKEFYATAVGASENPVNCPKQGTVSARVIASTIEYNFNTCQTDIGTAYSGAISNSIAQGPAKTNSSNISNLNYQLIDDRDIIKLNGNYTEKVSVFARSTAFSLAYNNGTNTFEYSVDPQKITSVHLKTTSISGYQHFILNDMAENGTALPPVLSADDDSNLSITFDSNGGAAIALRNTKDSAIIANKAYIKSEVENLLKGARRVKN